MESQPEDERINDSSQRENHNDQGPSANQPAENLCSVEGGSGPDMIDLTMDDDDDEEVIEIIDDDEDIQQIVANDELSNGQDGSPDNRDHVEKPERSLNYVQQQAGEEHQNQVEDDDEPIIEASITKSEEEKKEKRMKMIDGLLDWFLKLKAEHIPLFKHGGSTDYYSKFISEKCFLDVEKCKEIAEDFKNSGSLVGMAEKFSLENDDLLIFAICIGVLELNNSLDINFNVLSVDRVDDWSMKKSKILLDSSNFGAITKYGPLKFMQFTVTNPASALLLLTIIWLRENGISCQFNPEYDNLESIFPTINAFELSNKIVDASMKYHQLGKGNTSLTKQMNSALDDLFHEIETTTAEIKEHFENTVGEQAEILKLTHEKIPVFDEAELQDITFLTQEQRETLIKSRAEVEALREEGAVLLKAARDVYENKTDLEKKLVLNVGDYCLARAVARDEHELAYAIVQERVDNKNFKVQFIDSKQIRTCNIQDIAFTTIGVQDPILSSTGEVGLRVAVRRVRQISTYERKFSWVTGTTAGRRSAHGGNFLVFCDDGVDLYVKTPMKEGDAGYEFVSLNAPKPKTLQDIVKKMNAAQIAVMVSQPLSKDGLLDRFLTNLWVRQPTRAHFVKIYMKDYPEWPLLRMPLGMSIELRNMNEKTKSTVTVVGNDRAFAIVRHRNVSPSTPGYNCLEYPCKIHIHHDERIYRGSHRLEGAAHKIGLLTANNNLSKRRKVQLASQFEPAEVERSMPQRNNLIQESRRPMPVQNRIVVPKQDSKTEREVAERKRRQQLFDKIVVPTPVLPPKEELKFHPQCGPDCLRKMDEDPYEARFHRNSPLHTPLLCGWRRSKYTLSTGKRRSTFRKTIIYFAPCGKPLQTMASVSQYLRETRSQLTVDCFSFEDYLNTELYVTVPIKFIKHPDIGDKQEGIPIPVVNTVDNDDPPPLQYSKRRYNYDNTVDVTTINREFCSGCSCEGDCSNSETCECQKLSREAISRLPVNLQYDSNVELSGSYAYRNLTNKVITGMYECNDQCSCNRKSCHNRVVQNNIKYPMHIFKTAQSGWGCRALTDIPKGSFICTYAGALLTNELADKLQNDDQYFADLDLQDTVEMAKGKEDLETDYGYDEGDGDYSDEGGNESDKDEDKPVVYPTDSGESESTPRVTRQNKNKKENKSSTVDQTDNQENKEEEVFKWDDYFTNTLYVVDAKVRGNLGRFLNHSCSPNVEVQHVMYDTHDLRLPWVAFFTIKHVKAGDELAWDYRYTDLDKENVRIDCKCGADNCRRRLL